MAVTVDQDKCTGCKSCEEACPSSAIKVPEGKAQVSNDDCIDCNACVDACTEGAITAA